MITQNFSIDESEKKRILEMHKKATKKFYLVHEQKLSSNSENEVIDTEVVSDIFFKSGYWSENAVGKKGKKFVKEQIRDAFNKLKKFCYKYPNANIEVLVYSSESNVPNFDAEAKTETELEPGVLAERRATTVINILNDLFKESARVVKTPKEIKKIIVPPIDKFGEGDKRTDAKFSDEQYVKIEIRALAIKGCGFNIWLWVNYDAKAESSLPERHVCDAALYRVYANGVALKTSDGKDADLNNAKTNGGYRSNSFFISQEMGDMLLSKSPDRKTIRIEMYCLTPEGVDLGKGKGKCHKGVPHIIFQTEKKEPILDFLPTQNDFEKGGLLCVLDKCGNVIQRG